MSQDHWNRIKALFAEAGEHEPAEREDFVREHESDPEIVEAVLALLAHDDDAPLVSPLAARVGALEPGEMFGPYKVVRLIGQGGMGVIYQAERGDGQFQQKVAIKLLRSGHSGGQALVDAMREQRLLALLDHPNIARIIDAGIADSGQSFIVMDYVDGEDLITYCRNHELDLDERLALFRKICAAVSHAHRNLVLHRDLKPDNILVTDDGEPRLVDFGVARLLERAGGTTEPSTATIRGWTALTPEYASPEQIRGEPLTTATDIYALGITLYELLTGERPYRFASRSPEEIVRTVTEAPVDPPSRRAGTSAQSPVTARMLRGDLDMITAQAMHRDPERRYASAQALADDLDRFVRGLPIAARADSIGYRVRKFVRRQKLPVGVAAVALILVMAGLSAAWMNNRARLAEAERAQSLSRFMLRMFDSVTPSERQGEEFTVTRLLDSGVERARIELSGQPELLHRVLLRIADTHLILGNRDRAADIARLIRENLVALPVGDLAHLETRTLTGDLKRAEEDWPAAKAIYQEVLGDLDAHPEADREHRMDARIDLARMHLQLDEFSSSEPLIDEALKMAEQPPSLDPRDALTALASARLQRGELESAYAVIIRILDAAEKWDAGRVTVSQANHHNDASAILARLGRHEEALTHSNSALSIMARLEGEDSPRYARYLKIKAVSLEGQGKPEQALEATTRAIEILQDSRPDSVDLRETMGIHAGALMALGRHGEAASVFRRVLTLYERSLDPDDPGAVVTRMLLAVALLAEQDVDAVLETIQAANQALERSNLPENARMRVNLKLRLSSLEVVGATLKGSHEMALSIAEQARETMGKPNEDDRIQLHSWYVINLWQGVALEALDRHNEAAARFEEAERLYPLIPPHAVALEKEYARRYQDAGFPFPPDADEPDTSYSDND